MYTIIIILFLIYCTMEVLECIFFAGLYIDLYINMYIKIW